MKRALIPFDQEAHSRSTHKAPKCFFSRQFQVERVWSFLVKLAADGVSVAKAVGRFLRLFSFLSFVENLDFGLGCVVFLAFRFTMMPLFSSWQCKTFVFFGGSERAIATCAGAMSCCREPRFHFGGYESKT